MKLWAERENEGPQQLSPSDSNQSRESSSTPSSSSSESSKTAATATTAGEENSGNNAHQDGGSGGGSPGVSDTTSRIYDEAASLLAHNRAVLGQALARSGQADRGIAELEIACPEIMEYQQNAHGRRDSKSELLIYNSCPRCFCSCFGQCNRSVAEVLALNGTLLSPAPGVGDVVFSSFLPRIDRELTAQFSVQWQLLYYIRQYDT